MKEKNRIFPIGLILASLWFFFNPNISIVDILPDCIGCALILLALRRVDTIIPYFGDAQDSFRKLLYVTLSKIPALLILLTLSQERVSITLFSLSFAILELLFAIPAFSALFEGFFYLGQRFDCSAAISRSPVIPAPERLKRITLIFLSVKAAASTLPEFGFLFSYDPLTGTGFTMSVRLYLLLAGALAVAVLFFGILWLTFLRRYFSGIRDDAAFSVFNREVALLTRKKEYSRLRIGLPHFLFAAGAVLCVDPILDNVEVIPDALSMLAFLAAAFCLPIRKGKKERLLPIVFPAAGFVSTILFSTFRSAFYASYTDSDITRIGEAGAAYLPVMIFSALSEILFFLTVFFLLRALADFRADKLPAFCPKTDYEQRMHEREEREQAHRERVLLAFAGIAAVASFFRVFLTRFTERVSMNPGYGGGAVYLPVFGWFRTVQLVLSVILAVLAVNFCRDRTQELFREEPE